MTRSPPPTTRTRTPPVLKWLLNERAALAGNAQRLQQKLAHIQAELDAALGKVAALDATLSALAPNVAP